MLKQEFIKMRIYHSTCSKSFSITNTQFDTFIHEYMSLGFSPHPFNYILYNYYNYYVWSFNSKVIEINISTRFVYSK